MGKRKSTYETSLTPEQAAEQQRELAALLTSEPCATAYAGDAAEIISTGADALEGVLDVLDRVETEIGDSGVRAGTRGTLAEELEALATTAIRGAHLLLHAAAEARMHAAKIGGSSCSR